MQDFGSWVRLIKTRDTNIMQDFGSWVRLIKTRDTNIMEDCRFIVFYN